MEGIAFFGSYARKSLDFYSDLDSFIYLNQSKGANGVNTVKELIRQILLDDDQGVSNEFAVDDKWVIFTKKTLIKIEISIKSISEAIGDVTYIAESRISSPRQAIAYDRNNKLFQIYSENWIVLNEFTRLKGLFIKEVHKFIYYFEIFLANMAKEDEYKAYMNYTISFYKLAGLKAMVEGEHYNIFQPRKFTTEIIRDWNLRVKYYKASAGLRKYDMLEQRYNLEFLFLDVLENGIKKFDLNVNFLTEIKRFLKGTSEKYLPFKNLRDIGLVVNNYSKELKLKEGLIYRAAALSKNSSELILKFLKEKSIRYILDLRGEGEIENYIKYNNFYDDQLKENYIINIPLEPDINVYIKDTPYENFYYAFLKDFMLEIKLIFEKYFVAAQKNRLIIHCEGGKDRTGILIAILLDLLGFSREFIMADYLLSYSDTKRYYIDLVFMTIDEEYGGTEKYLANHCNVSRDSINTIREVLVEKK